MNIEEAAKSYGSKNYPKTMGELLDEGYLFQSRLEWAAEKAYVPQIKEAAKVILAFQKNAPNPANHQAQPAPAYDVGVSLEKARATLWPMYPFKGLPMGVLVDSQQLSLKDLGFAVENAWDEKVRRAAMALLLTRLDQVIKEPSSSEGYAKLISGGRSYSQRQETRWTMLQGFIFGVILTALIALTLISIKPKAGSGTSLQQLISTPAGIVGLIIVIAICFLLYWLINFLMDFLSKRLDKKIEEYRLGQEGEEKVTQTALQALDGNWHVVRNLSIPGANKGDLDLVLVGPPGVWALEVKNFRGEYRNMGETWERRHGKIWKSASVNPSRQAFKNAVRLGNFLKADHINAFVTPVVVWANQESPFHVENPSVAVWSLNHLTDELGNIWHGEKLSDAERNKIVEKFSKLCEKQRDAA